MKQRYRDFVDDLYIYGEYGNFPTAIEYYNNVVSYNLKQGEVFPTAESVIKDIASNSLADGLWEGNPGSTAVYPDSQGNELGVIGIKNQYTDGIKVKESGHIPKSFIKRERDDIYERADWVSHQLSISREMFFEIFGHLGDKDKYNSRAELKRLVEDYLSENPNGPPKHLSGKSHSDFGKKRNKRWIQDVTKTFAKKGTKGAFTRWCQKHGYPKVTKSCISLGKKSKSLRTRRRAVFAQNISHFGKSIKYLNSL
jgi:hypothetical protein